MHRSIARQLAGVIAPAIVSAFAVAALPRAVRSQTETGGFVATLGADTMHIERFTRTAERVEGMIITRVPQTRVARYVMTFGPDGKPIRYEVRTSDGVGVASAVNGSTGSWTFAGDTIVRETLAQGAMTTQRVLAPMGAYPSPAIPYVGISFLMYEYGFRDARQRRDSAIYQLTMLAGQMAPQRQRIWFVGTDSAEMNYFNVARSGYRFDSRGRLIRADWTGTTYRYRITRIDAPNLERLAQAWVEADARGAGVGAMSPRDSTIGTVGATRITLTYSRPAKRGRVVWGEVVRWDTVWRLGADVATHLTTSTDIRIGSADVPAGRYTIWMLPSNRGESMLIVNKQVNIFGTGYNPANDLVRIPLSRSSLVPSMERLTLAVENGRLWIRWDDAAWSVVVESRGAPVPTVQRAPRVIDVRGQFATIQQAIDSAPRGDTVLVAPGRYYENIRFKGGAILLTSRFARSGNHQQDRTLQYLQRHALQ